TSAFGALLAAIAMFFVFCVMFSEALLRALRGNPAQLNSAPQESGAAAIDDKNPWSSALQAMQEVMILVDGKGTISNVNRHIAKITDRTAEQLINTSYTDLLLDGCTEPRCGLTVTLDTTGYGECIHKYMGRINDVRIYTVADDSHTIDKNKVCVIRDITNMKEAEEALTDYTGRLQSSNRELQEFAYVASHDLQEPLRKIQTFAQRMQVKCRDQLDEHGQDYLDRMTNAANRMQKLINDLLVYSRIATKAAPFTMIDLSQAAADVISDLQIAIEQSGARIIVDELPTIEGDELQIRQLFQNLISNALKFRRPDVTPELHISVAPVNTAAAGNLPVHLVTNSCQIIVEDNGIGFDNKYTGKMFGMFQRLHGRSQYEGTGIGLAVCKKIVDRHRGTIEAIGEEGKGAKFVIQLPLSQQAQEKNIPPLQEAG
ncbi:MAG: ATP-binding protein, partial [Nitrospira sp.]|nr:ATP-binding protein [Nitrospira sp.]